VNPASPTEARLSLMTRHAEWAGASKPHGRYPRIGPGRITQWDRPRQAASAEVSSKKSGVWQWSLEAPRNWHMKEVAGEFFTAK
jgi:hypothetical protein